MPPRDARIADIAARFAAAGLVPQVKEYADRTSIEARVPEPFPEETWPALLALLETADSFGLVTTTRGRSVWAAVRKDAPAPADAAETPQDQP
ncbi:hypothetical protein OG552_17435 [Streptomyces sp. NBC_01476]|uniref:hypothetical protein n=1 Tax=Streptomyces sp. NBC_01476 TaxID=2903881 RepID=UPI002E3327AF|nr:hypothetical protein [Streptomyces sp. NBC_01476]